MNDIFPVLIIIPMFKSGWGGVFGTIDAFMFVGSIINFVAAPSLYTYGGVKCATLVASVVGISGLVFVILALIVFHKAEQMQNQSLSETNQTEDIVSLIELTRTEDSRSIAEDQCTFKKHDDQIYIPVSSTSGEDAVADNSHNTANSLDETIISYDTTDFFVCQKFSLFYYNYLISGCFLYGAMVPFMFIGSKLIQVTYDASVKVADRIVLIPEVLI